MIASSYDSLYQSGREALALGEADRARHLFSQALSARPAAPGAHFGLASACFLLDDLDSAAQHFKETTRLDPLRAGAFINLGVVLNRLGDDVAAVEALHAGLQLEPSRAEGFYNLGLVYRSLEQFEDAIAAYRQAIRLAPDMTDAYFNLGNLFLELERYQLAERLFQRVLRQQPDWEKAQHGLTQARLALASARAAEPAAAPDTTVEIDVEQRRLNPEVHGQRLAALHQAVKQAQLDGLQMARLIEKELEPAVHELVTALIHARDTHGAGEINERIDQFEQAAAHFRQVRAHLFDYLQRSEQLGQKLLGS